MLLFLATYWPLGNNCLTDGCKRPSNKSERLRGTNLAGMTLMMMCWVLRARVSNREQGAGALSMTIVAVFLLFATPLVNQRAQLAP